jgi:4'-phosphopantetheinyl transferase
MMELFEVLGEEERIRASRFRFERDRCRYVAAHGQLREILARYVGEEPEALRFRLGKFGKPALLDSIIHFNLSHSLDLAMCAVSSRCPVGIDVEYVRDEMSVMDVSERFFAPDEKARIRALQGCEQKEHFFRIWTAKEAYLKATGDGLSRAADSFELIFSEHGSPCGIRNQFEWHLGELSAPDGFKAALAVFGLVPQVSFFSA